MAIVPNLGLLPFPYPPPFLAIVTPFALMPFSTAFVLWVVLTSLVYALGAARVAPLPYAFANPPILVDLMIGQTGLLVGGIFMSGLALIFSAPFTAGAIFGLLVLKPQLALMLPVATVAGRMWKVLAGALLSLMTVLLAGLLLFGRESYQGFFAILPYYAGFIGNSSWNWVELASPFAFARFLGIDQSPALMIQAFFSVAAGGLTWIAWSRDWEEKLPILAAASLLASPYLLTYDAVLLIVPAGHLLARRRLWLVALLWLLCALPVVHFYGLYDGPNTIPLAAAISLGVMARSHVRPSDLARISNAQRAPYS